MGYARRGSWVKTEDDPLDVASGVPRGHRLSPAVRLTVSAFLCCSPPSHSCLRAPTSRSSSNKMLGAAEFQTVQRIYRGWELFGVVVLSALASTLALKIGLRRHPTAFTPALVAVLCIVAGRFLDLHIPVNRMTINWTMLPHNWAELRASWEYSHAPLA